MTPHNPLDADKSIKATPDAAKETASADSIQLNTNIRIGHPPISETAIKTADAEPVPTNLLPDAPVGAQPIELEEERATRFGLIDVVILVGSCLTTMLLARYAEIGWRTYISLSRHTLATTFVGGMIVRDWFLNFVSGLTMAGIVILFVQWTFRGRKQTSANSGEWAWIIQGAVWLLSYPIDYLGGRLGGEIVAELLGPVILLFGAIQCICIGLSVKFVLANTSSANRQGVGCLWAGWGGVVVSLLVLIKAMVLDSVIMLP